MDSVNTENKIELRQLAQTSEPVLRNEIDNAGLPVSVTMDQLLMMENSKNPMLLSPVIRCVLKFLNVEDIKTCRFLSREWSSIGKLALSSGSVIQFYKQTKSTIRKPIQLPVDFYSCFLNSASLFSAFHISGSLAKKSVNNYWTIEELTKFFDKQQKYMKTLTLNFEFNWQNIEKRLDLSSWISKSPMVQNDVKHMTKLSIKDNGNILDIPLHLIAHTKDLSLEKCRVNLEAGIKICPTKLKLAHVTFYQDGIKLDRLLINDIVDLGKAKEVILLYENFVDFLGHPKYAVDFRGNFTLDKLVLTGNIEILNGETSQWAVEQLETFLIPYSLNSQMEIKELSLFSAGTIDLFKLPTSIHKLALDKNGDGGAVICSEPIVLEDLQYLSVKFSGFSFLSYFMNCPQLSFLEFSGQRKELKSLWMPKNIKTLTLECCEIYWIEDSYLNLEKVVLRPGFATESLEKFFKAKIRVDDVVVHFSTFTVNEGEGVVHLLKLLINFCKRFYIGKLEWKEQQLENSALKEHVDVKSSFYVFENGEKGRPLSEKAFSEILPKHNNIFNA